MPAGSVLLWMGGHAAMCRSESHRRLRYGVFLSYSLGWIRQEENQYVDVPYDIARTLTKAVRDPSSATDAHGNRLLRRLRKKQSRREALMRDFLSRAARDRSMTRGFDPELWSESARPPVYRSSTFVFPSPEAAERAFGIVLGENPAARRTIVPT